MAENELDQNLNQGEKHPVDERLTKAFDKIKTAEQEKSDALKAKDEADKKLADLEKKNQFLSSFSDISAKYQGANEFKADIEAKVMAGYTVEDATVSVLNAKGKLTAQPSPAPTPDRTAPGGGSAATTIRSDFSTDKPIHEMTHEEKRQAIMELEKRGEISVN
jgi:hypothetical protein